MSRRSEMVEILDNYFKEQGKIFDVMEYKYSEDVPIRPGVLRKVFGSWGRLEKIIMARRERSTSPTNVDEVLAARHAAEVARTSPVEEEPVVLVNVKKEVKPVKEEINPEPVKTQSTVSTVKATK